MDICGDRLSTDFDLREGTMLSWWQDRDALTVCFGVLTFGLDRARKLGK